MDLQQWLKGKKTYLISIWLFAGALYAVMNDLGDEQMNILIGSVGAIAATLRAGINKTNGAKLIALPACLGLLLLTVGCASLGKVDPATGTTPAQDIVQGATELSSAFPPPFNMVIPLGVGGILTILTAIGKAKDIEAQPPT